MSTSTALPWRKVELTDYRSTVGWAEEDLFDEVPLFKEFISPYNKHQPQIHMGGIYRMWKEFRGDDHTYKLSLNDIKRLWTALSLIYPDNPLYNTIPQEAILYDGTTKAIINRLMDVPGEQ